MWMWETEQQELLTSPEWVIVGCEDGEGVMILASDSLTAADLTWMQQHDPHPPSFGNPLGGLRRYRIGAETHEVVVVFGATYREALAKLFGM